VAPDFPAARPRPYPWSAARSLIPTLAPAALATALAISASGLPADRIGGDMASTASGQQVAMSMTAELLPSGGDFDSSTGTAALTFTILNTSCLVPPDPQPVGNPILAAFYFNLPPGASAALEGVWAQAGGMILVKEECVVLALDRPLSQRYALVETASAGEFGLFTHSLQTRSGVIWGLLNPEVLGGCARGGGIFAPVALAGPLTFTLALQGLDRSLDSAADLRAIPSVARGTQTPAVFAARFLGMGLDGSRSATAGAAWSATPVTSTTWSGVKALFR
jgi:hypothetical protein